MDRVRPKISIIVPIYNVEAYLDHTLYSVVNQTLKDIEIICVNDCSTDRSQDILDRFLAEDDRIKLIKHRCRIIAQESYRTNNRRIHHVLGWR